MSHSMKKQLTFSLKYFGYCLYQFMLTFAIDAIDLRYLQ